MTGQELLNRIASHEARKVFLAGAGISIPTPSSLPSGLTLTSGTVDRLSPTSHIREELRALCSPNASGYARVRFELLMSTLEASADPKVALLNYIDNCVDYNMNHQIIAGAITAGAMCLTTNFDNLIERAALSQLEQLMPVVVDDSDLHPIATVAGGMLIKLHGSLRRYSHGVWEDARGSIVSTLESVGRLGNGFSLRPQLRALLASVLHTGMLVVVGYSGSDDFDVWPLLRSVQSEGLLVWVVHTPKTLAKGLDLAVLHRSSSDMKLNRMLDQLVEVGAWRHDQIYVIEADTTDVLQRIHPSSFSGIAAKPNRQGSLEEFLDDWERTHLSRTGAKELVCGLLFLRAAAYDIAETMLLVAAQQTSDQGVQLQAYDYLSNLYALTGAYADSKKYCNLVLEAGPSRRQTPLYYLGMVEHLAGNYSAAEVHFRRSIDAREGGGRGYNQLAVYSLLFIARIWHERRDYGSAERLYKQVSTLLQESGDLYHYALCSHQLGSLYMGTGDPVSAEQHFRTALSLRAELDDQTGIAATTHELGFLASERGDLAQALQLFEESLNRERAIGNPHGLADSLTAVGHMYLEVGDVIRARPYFVEALEWDLRLGREAEAGQDVRQIEEIDGYLARNRR